MGLFRKTISKGEKIPAFYAPVRFDFASERTDVVIFPFSIFVALATWLWANIVCLHISIDEDPRVAYNQGYKDGKKAQ